MNVVHVPVKRRWWVCKGKTSGLSLGLGMLILFGFGSAGSASAAVYTNADVASDLVNAARWVGGSAPNWADTANGNILLWDSTLATAANCTNNTGSGTLNVNGLRILNPAAAVCLTNNSTAFLIRGNGSAGAGIDMSAATVDMRIVSTVNSFYFENAGSTYTITVATNRTLTFDSVGVYPVRIRNTTVTLDGAGTVGYYGNVGVGQDYASGVATLNINNGVLSNTSLNNFRVPYNTTTGIVNQAGGRAALGHLYVGDNGPGTYNLSGGVLTLGGGAHLGVNGGNGAVNVSGGTIAQAGTWEFTVGDVNTGTCSYVQSGSSTVTAGTFRVAYGVKSVGNFTVSNGTFYAGLWDALASATNATGHITLVGGTAILPAFPTNRAAGAYADITLDGGTLTPRAATAAYMQGLDHAYLTVNGAVFGTAGNSITVSQVLENAASQAGTLTKTGLGTLTLAGANTYSGGTAINGGLLQFNSGALPASGLVTINAGGALNVAGAYTTVANWLNSGRIATNSAGAIALAASSSEAIDLSAGSYSNLMLGASAAATYSGTLTPYNKTYRFGGGGATLTVSSALPDISGACSLVAGASGSAGTVVLSSANTYSGGTTLAGGTLSIGNANSLGSGLLTILDGTTLSSTAALTATNTLNLVGGLTVNISSGNLTLTGAMTNSGSLVKSGTSALILKGTNTYSGGTTLNGGSVQTWNVSALGTGPITINSGCVIDLWQLGVTNHNDFYINSAGVAGGNSALMADGAGGMTAWFDGTITLGVSNSTIGTYDSNPMSILGKLTGSGGLTKGAGRGNENGVLTLYNPNNDYSGNTVVTVGRLKLGASNVLPFGVGKGDVILNGTASTNIVTTITLDLNGFNQTINGLSGTNNILLGQVLNDATGTTNTLTVGANNATSAFAGLIKNGNGKLALAKTGTGTLTLSGTNTYNAGTVISNGFIAIGNDKALGTGPVTLAGGSLMGAGGNWTVSNAVSVVSNATLDTAGNNLTLAGAVTNIGSLTKIGAGTLTLAGTNGYAGLLTVSNGVLRLATTNAIASNNSLVMAGGSCDLNGQTQVVSTVTGTAPFSNGTLQVTGSLTPGGTDAVGTLPVAGNLIVGENAVINWNYGNSTQDLIQVTGALALPAVATVNVSRVTGSTAEFPKPGVVFSFGSCTRSGTLSQWVINGAPRSDIRAVVRDGQVVLVPASGMILEIQ